MKKFALAGNPNSGKTTLFNALTGSTAHVGNWPGVTVDKREGVYKKTPERVGIIDLPGIYSLSPYTPEEVIARNYILDEKPDCVINIVDSTNLERNLYLTTQLLEIDVPVVIALNLSDVLAQSGDSIDAAELEKRIGIPVVSISALKGTGVGELMTRAYEASNAPREGKSVLDGTPLAHLVGDVKIALEGKSIASPLFHSVKLIENDEIETKMHPDCVRMVDAFKKTFKDETFDNDLEAVVADKRYNYITSNFSPLIKRKEVPESEKFGGVRLTRSDKADKVLTHRIWGIPIFLVILFAIFHLTFSEDFLFLGFFGAVPGDWVSLEGTFFEGLFGAGGINSPGVILFNFLDSLMGGLSEVTALGLETAGAADWATGFVVDGVLGGLFAVMSFLPQIMLLFLFFSILEDSGYMARIAFILDRIFRRFGLSGRAFMPMIMGFGCSVPAIINTRTLADERERTATIRVIPFFSCGAKLPILVAIAGGIGQMAGLEGVEFITYLMYLLGMAVAIASVIVMRSTTMKGEGSPFIMELPSYRFPKFSALMLHLWDKLKHFIKKAFTIILASTIIIWVISHFSPSLTFLADEEMNESILAHLGMAIQVLFTPLGFGSQLGTWGWVFGVAAVTGLIAKENVIATFGALAACIVGATVEDGGEGVEYVAEMVAATGITVPALLSFIAFNMTTIPCFAAVATARAELPKGQLKWTILFWIVVSYLVGMMIYLIGEFIWPVAIFAVIIALFICYMILDRRGKFDRFKKKKDKIDNKTCCG